MSGQMITDARVLALIEAYGADPDMFPEAERLYTALCTAELPSASESPRSAFSDGCSAPGLSNGGGNVPLAALLHTSRQQPS